VTDRRGYGPADLRGHVRGRSGCGAPPVGSVWGVSPDGFVPSDFEVPAEAVLAGLRLVPLGPEHNDADHGAWTSSIDHIRATPGFPDGSWPRPMSLDENRRDLERHRDDFTHRRGFTYTVLDPQGDVVGCVYLYPSTDGRSDVVVQSWVRASRAELDRPLDEAVRAWLHDVWPFGAVQAYERPPDGGVSPRA
jgi:hypothetical protein